VSAPPIPATSSLPKRLPVFHLRYGQVLWLLTELGYGEGTSKDAFHEYMKSLRKLGIPFGNERFQTKYRRRLAQHSYYHIMELAVALSLRVYHVVPDSVLRGLIRYRRELHELYRRAYFERCRGSGRPVILPAAKGKRIEIRGVFLDLRITFRGGHLIRIGPPRLLSSIGALGEFSRSAGPSLLIGLSHLSEQIVALALRAPDIRSGPVKSTRVAPREFTRSIRRLARAPGAALF
jgi:hypothetical protein